MSRLEGEKKALLVRDGSTEGTDDYEIKTYSDNIVLTSTTQKETGESGKSKPNSELTKNEKYTSLNDFLAKAEAAYDLGTDSNGNNGNDLPKAIRLNGENASSAPDYSVAIGEETEAYYCGVAVGKNTHAGNIALAVGTNLLATGENSASFGNNNHITNDGAQSMVIGVNNTIDSKNSFICGDNNNIQIGEYTKIYKGGIAKVSSNYYYSIDPRDKVISKLLLRPSQDNMDFYYTDNPFYDAYVYMKDNGIEKANATLCLNSTENEFLVNVTPILGKTFFGFYIENYPDELIDYIESIKEIGSHGTIFTWVQINIEVGEEFSPTEYGKSGCAIGTNNIVKGSSSVALGSNIIADRKNKIVVGNFNSPDKDNIFEVGCGTSEEDRKNALSIDKDGIVKIGEKNYLKSSGQITANLSTNVDQLSQITTLRLTKGIWIISANVTFNSGETSGDRNLAIAITTDADYWGIRQTNKHFYSLLSTTTIKCFNKDTTVYLKGASEITPITGEQGWQARGTIIAARIG